MLASMTDTVEKFLILVLHLISLFSEILLVEQAIADVLVEHLARIVGSPPFYQEHLFLAQVHERSMQLDLGLHAEPDCLLECRQR